ncbi:copper chaperone PCu(A)C [Glacieibacterium sp.]|uniref:copper chaperone PCu(A)C n=1 Tax=Glacieibacterium sp. TaxID=2860237 RepID=UPI003AFF9861
MNSAIERILGWGACAVSLALLVVALLLGTTATAATGGATGPSVRQATVRLAAVPGRPSAGYFTLNGGTAGDTLTSVVSPLAERIEMHSSSMAGGVMRMDKLPAVKSMPGETVRFAPGGNHLMIFGVAATVKPGATLPLTFRFASGAVVKVDATSVAAGATMPMAMSHGGH